MSIYVQFDFPIRSLLLETASFLPWTVVHFAGSYHGGNFERGAQQAVGSLRLGLGLGGGEGVTSQSPLLHAVGLKTQGCPVVLLSRTENRGCDFHEDVPRV